MGKGAGGGRFLFMGKWTKSLKNTENPYIPNKNLQKNFEKKD
jgi:hypothetical protein